MSSLGRHTEVSRGEHGNWKIIVSEEPDVSENQRCDTLDTSALALLGVAVSVRSALGISGLASEIKGIEQSFAKLRAQSRPQSAPLP